MTKAKHGTIKFWKGQQTSALSQGGSGLVLFPLGDSQGPQGLSSEEEPRPLAPALGPRASPALPPSSGRGSWTLPHPGPRKEEPLFQSDQEAFSRVSFSGQLPPEGPKGGKGAVISKALVMCYDSFSCFKQMFMFVSNSAFTFLYYFSERETSIAGKGQGSLACCSPWGRREWDATEWLNWTLHKLPGPAKPGPRQISSFLQHLAHGSAQGPHCRRSTAGRRPLMGIHE